MRVFHFVPDDFGLDDIRRRRLKIATIDDLNDPFEFLGIDLRDQVLRRAVQKAKSEFSKVSGLLCFSRRWHNPVQWSHYAAKHAGLCLGFDVPDHLVSPIIYAGRRFAVDVQQMRNSQVPDPRIFERILFTKYAHWRYEAEVRAMPNLQQRDPVAGLYFAEFSNDLILRQVIVGARSSITRDLLSTALGNLAGFVEAFKTRLAFSSFRVVRQKDPSQWA
jgi:hypothetical protein